jgi:3-dehydroquinate synthase
VLKTNSANTVIYIGELLTDLKKYIPENSIIITDKNVYKYYNSFISDYKSIIIKPGEQSKSIDTVDKIIEQLLKYGADRNTFLVGFGGGVITDITGFVASIFYRGLNFGYVSTTLLGQVDASIGGKNGVDFNSIKNVIGTIEQPKFILSDSDTLKTLQPPELMNGSIEAIKTALISDAILYNYLKKNYNQIMNLNTEIIEDIVYKTAKIKADIVMQDEKENDVRRILNFGHTVGHAIESLTGLSHGQAVREGMITATKLSVILSKLDNSKAIDIVEFLSGIKFQKKIKIDKEEVFNYVLNDKKRFGNSIKLVLLKDIGVPVIKEIEIEKLRKLYYDMC